MIVGRREVEAAIEDAEADRIGSTLANAIAFGNLAIAKALLRIGDLLEEMEKNQRAVASGGDKYLEVRTTDA